MYIQEFNIYYYSVEYMMSCVLYKNSYLTFYSEICRPCIIFTFIKHLDEWTNEFYSHKPNIYSYREVNNNIQHIKICTCVEKLQLH